VGEAGRGPDVQGLDVAARRAIGFAQIEVNKRPAQAMLAAIEGEGGNFYRFVYASQQRFSRAGLAEFEESLRASAGSDRARARFGR
jgi:hypothetical protein